MEKIAVVELGFSQVKMVIAEVGQDYFFEIARLTEFLRFGFESSRDKLFKKAHIDEVVLVLKNFKKLCEVHGVNKTYANAIFSDSNKPKNIYSFLDEVFATTGFRFVLPSSHELLGWGYTGVINSLDCPKAVVLNVTADAVCTLQYNRRNILGEAILPISPLFLLEEFPVNDFDDSPSRFKAIAAKVREEIDKLPWIGPIEEEIAFVACGGLLEDLAGMIKRMRKYPLALLHNYVCTAKDVSMIADQMSAMELDSSKTIKGIGGRADIFAVAVLIAKAFTEKLGTDNVTFSKNFSIEGFLFNMSQPSTLEKPIADVLSYSVDAVARYLEADGMKHNEHVNNLATLLYKQLKVLHKLPRGFSKVLKAAAILHDSGKRVNPADHAEHSYYVIQNSDIYGLSHREILLASFAASLHDGGEISLQEWVAKKDLLTQEDMDAVRKLGVILRLAESFDVQDSGLISDINCDVLGDSVIMKTVTCQDNSFELYEAKKASRDFEKNFKKRLEVL